MWPPDALALLRSGAITVKGRLPWSSNITLLAELSAGEASILAVYKPGRGERPLWDFPPDLYKRELAAYLFSEALGWGLVPPTVVREGPFGEGSLQWFVRADFEQHYLTLLEEPRHRLRLQQICAFDLLANNADRKSGHCLLAPDGRVYAIDNGLTFHPEPKLRTVIWDFAGEPIPGEILADIKRLGDKGLPEALAALLEPDERETLLLRAKVLVEGGDFPADSTGQQYPWPLV